MKKYNKIRTSIIAIFILFFVFTSIIESQQIISANAEEIHIEKQESLLSKDSNETTLQSILKSKTINYGEYLYNLDESPDYIYLEFAEGGYVVLSCITEEIMEYSPLGTLPFSDSLDKDYYAGPLNYFHKNENYFTNLLSNETIEINLSQVEEFSEKTRLYIMEKTKYRSKATLENYNIEENNTRSSGAPNLDEDNLIVSNRENATLIANHRYFLIEPTYGENKKDEYYGNFNKGTCGPVSAQLLLSYNNYYNDRRIIDDRFLNGYSDSSNSVVDVEKNPNYCTDPMSMDEYTTGTRSESDNANGFYYEMINRMMAPNQINTPFNDVRDGITDYLSDNLPANSYIVNSGTGSWLFWEAPISSTIIQEEIDEQRPVIIETRESLGATNHYVVGYGYQDYTYPDGSGTYNGYIVNYGHKGKSSIWINSAWCRGYISLELTHEHSYPSSSSNMGPNGPIYTCSTCGHRTDAIINMTSNDCLIERTAPIPLNGLAYKDFRVKFSFSGNMLFQTISQGNPKLQLLDSNYSLLKQDDNSGYNLQALMCYTVQANTEYILRVGASSTTATVPVKFIITPASATYSDYDSIWYNEGTNVKYDFQALLNTTRVMTFTATEAGNYIFKTEPTGNTALPPGNVQFPCKIYLIDVKAGTIISNCPTNETINSQMTCSLNTNRKYCIVVSASDISTQEGQIRLSIDKAT